jgi:hypothetical protein
MTIVDVDEIPANADGHANCGLLVNNLRLQYKCQRSVVRILLRLFNREKMWKKSRTAYIMSLYVDS